MQKQRERETEKERKRKTDRRETEQQIINNNRLHICCTISSILQKIVCIIIMNEFTRVGNVALRVNTQIFKVEFKKIFLFFLTALFCCDVGGSGLELKVTPWGAYINRVFITSPTKFQRSRDD